MIFCTAMQSMKQGKKVARASWTDILYWYVPEKSADVIQAYNNGITEIIKCIAWRDIRADDWLILD